MPLRGCLNGEDYLTPDEVLVPKEFAGTATALNGAPGKRRHHIPELLAVVACCGRLPVPLEARASFGSVTNLPQSRWLCKEPASRHFASNSELILLGYSAAGSVASSKLLA